jgi:methylenetetrahydrofolate reductase (NADPH)
MKINSIPFENGPIYSFEFFPPKNDDGFSQLFETIGNLKSWNPGYVSVTYGAGGSTRSKTIELATRIKHDIGIETMAHLTCAGHDRGELHAILSQLQEAGIDNILALRGDPPQGDSHFVKTENGFEYANELVAFIKKNFSFCIGVAGYPEGHVESTDRKQDLLHLKRKIDAGADFIVTQLFFDNKYYFEFVENIRQMGIELPVIPGIMPILNGKQIRRFTKMCGASLPDSLNSRLEEVLEDNEAVRAIGIEYAKGQCEELIKKGAPGIHFYTLNRSRATLAILEHLTQLD